MTNEVKSEGGNLNGNCNYPGCLSLNTFNVSSIAASSGQTGFSSLSGRKNIVFFKTNKAVNNREQPSRREIGVADLARMRRLVPLVDWSENVRTNKGKIIIPPNADKNGGDYHLKVGAFAPYLNMRRYWRNGGKYRKNCGSKVNASI